MIWLHWALKLEMKFYLLIHFYLIVFQLQLTYENKILDWMFGKTKIRAMK